jgi:Spy/CpxP family protein refolding chaperone
MKKIVIISAIILALACTITVWSQSNRSAKSGQQKSGSPPRMGGMMLSPAMAVTPPSEEMVNRLDKSLNLTDTQTAKIKKIISGNEKSLTALQKKAETASQELRSSLLKSSYDAKKVKALADKALKAETAVVNASISEWTKIRSVLTYKQCANLPSAMKMDTRRGGPGEPPSGFAPPPGGPRGQ